MNECLLCNGHGYITLLVGGTETCVHCKGAGTKEAEEPKTVHSR